MKKIKYIPIITFLTIIYFLAGSFNIPMQKKWVAPTSADKIVNPIKTNATTIASGKKLFASLCSVCHGLNGKGDGIAGTGLTPKPTNFTTEEFQSQTDGTIFWKLEQGRSPMPAYGTSIPEKKRWEIINYIRTLKK